MILSFVLVLHIFSVIYWIGGLLMITSLLSRVPDEVGLPKERFLGASQKQFEIITHVGAVITIATGVALISFNPHWLKDGWFQLKLMLVGILLLYHVRFYRQIRFLEDNPSQTSQHEYSVVHAMVSLVLFAILLLAVLGPKGLIKPL